MLKIKIVDNKLVLTQADKGKMIVILHQQKYNQKVANLWKVIMQCVIVGAFSEKAILHWDESLTVQGLDCMVDVA